MDKKIFAVWACVYLLFVLIFSIVTWLTIDYEVTLTGYIWAHGMECWLSFEIANKLTKWIFGEK